MFGVLSATALTAGSLIGAGIASDTPAQCQYRYAADGQLLPDPLCTPGGINPGVTQDTIDSTICVSGYTKKIRPSVAVTNKLKAISRLDYGWTGDMRAAEFDHLISLELGGAPTSISNLWFEPGPVPNPKDAVEHKLHALVCSHQVSLAAAQAAIASDWTTAVQVVSAKAFDGVDSTAERDPDDK